MSADARAKTSKHCFANRHSCCNAVCRESHTRYIHIDNHNDNCFTWNVIAYITKVYIKWNCCDLWCLLQPPLLLLLLFAYCSEATIQWHKTDSKSKKQQRIRSIQMFVYECNARAQFVVCNLNLSKWNSLACCSHLSSVLNGVLKLSASLLIFHCKLWNFTFFFSLSNFIAFIILILNQ